MNARWKQVNPELIGTKLDVLIETARDLRETLGGENMDAGMDASYFSLKGKS